MSGSWDRPSSPSPDDREQSWPAEDFESPTETRPSAEPWSADDPWQERRDSNAGWDDWTVAPPSEDNAYAPPELPSSDPWAESWTDETGPQLPSSEEPDWRPEREPAPEPTAVEPMHNEPSWSEPEPPLAPVEAIEAAPAAPDVPAFTPASSESEAPTIEPWSPDADPWGIAATETWPPIADQVIAEPESAPPVTEPEPEPEPEPVSPVEVAAEGTAAEPEPSHTAEGNGVPPDWLAEPEPAYASIFGPIITPPEPEPEVTPPAEPEPESELESQPTHHLDAMPSDTADAVPEGPPWAAALWGEPRATIEPEIESASEVESVSDVPAPAEPTVPDPNLIADLEQPDATQVFPSTWAPPVHERAESGELEPIEGAIRTSLAERGEPIEQPAEEPSTAEQAVPWLIGLILLLAGMVIVLLALIFAGDASLAGAGVLPSPSGGVGFVPGGGSSGAAGESASAQPSRSAAPSTGAAASATPVPGPVYGALDMVYQGRAAALKPIFLLRRDFSIEEDPKVMAQDPALDIHRMAWAPDGTQGAGLYDDLLIAIEPDDKRQLADGISAITFGPDAKTVYAVRITADGANDVATVVSIDFASGDSKDLARVTYKRPDIGAEETLKEAQFADDGGTVRLFWTADGELYLWSLGAGAWTIDPADGTATEADEDALPTLWSADGRHRVAISVKDETTTLTALNASDAHLGTTTVEGLVSHLRWSPDGKQVVFTVGRSAGGGGVLQDLYLWNLDDAPDGCSADAASNCQMLTNTGAAFGAEWLGTAARWQVGAPDA